MRVNLCVLHDQFVQKLAYDPLSQLGSHQEMINNMAVKTHINITGIACTVAQCFVQVVDECDKLHIKSIKNIFGDLYRLQMIDILHLFYLPRK